METPASTESAQEQDAGFGDEMTITVSRETYRSGEDVTFAIANHSDQAAYYVYGGCGWPTIRKVVGDDFRPLITRIIESVPDPTEVRPGETHVCSWDQQVWQDPSMQGRPRFANAVERAPVPPGQYQFILVYYLDWEDALSFENRRTTYSRVFSVE